RNIHAGIHTLESEFTSQASTSTDRDGTRLNTEARMEDAGRVTPSSMVSGTSSLGGVRSLFNWNGVLLPKVRTMFPDSATQSVSPSSGCTGDSSAAVRPWLFCQRVIHW